MKFTICACLIVLQNVLEILSNFHSMLNGTRLPGHAACFREFGRQERAGNLVGAEISRAGIHEYNMSKNSCPFFTSEDTMKVGQFAKSTSIQF